MSFGANAKYQKSKTSSTETTTPNLPDWFKTAQATGATNIAGLAGKDAATLVPGRDILQTKAAQAAGALNPGMNEGSAYGMDKLKALIGLQSQGAPTVSAASLLDNLSAYQNPYTRDVVDASLADFDQNAGKVRAQQALDLAGHGAFGGSGAPLTVSATEGELARARHMADAGLRSDAFNVGANLSSQDATRRQGASSDNANLKIQNRGQIAQNAAMLAGQGLAADANTRANIGAQSEVGAVNRGVESDQALAPFTLQDMINKLYAGLNPELATGKTTTGSGKSSGFGFDVSASSKSKG